MIRLIIKLALAALISHATWRVGSAYINHYRFKDAVREAAMIPRASDVHIFERIMELASRHAVPLDEENLAVQRDTRDIFIDASYALPIEVVPGYRYPWQFAWSIDVAVLPGAGGLAPERAPGSRSP